MEDSMHPRECDQYWFVKELVEDNPGNFLGSHLSLAAAACYEHCCAFSCQKQFSEFFLMGCFHGGVFVVKSGGGRKGPDPHLELF